MPHPFRKYLTLLVFSFIMNHSHESPTWLESNTYKPTVEYLKEQDKEMEKKESPPKAPDHKKLSQKEIKNLEDFQATLKKAQKETLDVESKQSCTP